MEEEPNREDYHWTMYLLAPLLSARNIETVLLGLVLIMLVSAVLVIVNVVEKVLVYPVAVGGWIYNTVKSLLGWK